MEHLRNFPRVNQSCNQACVSPATLPGLSAGREEGLGGGGRQGARCLLGFAWPELELGLGGLEPPCLVLPLPIPLSFSPGYANPSQQFKPSLPPTHLPSLPADNHGGGRGGWSWGEQDGFSVKILQAGSIPSP